MPASSSPPPEASIRSAAFWSWWLSTLLHRTIRASSSWALFVSALAVVDKSIVITDPWLRLRWIIVAGILCAAVGPLPLSDWMKTSQG